LPSNSRITFNFPKEPLWSSDTTSNNRRKRKDLRVAKTTIKA